MLSTRLSVALAASLLALFVAAPQGAFAQDGPPMTEDGWLDVAKMIVPSDGTRVPAEAPGAPRDRGSRIAFFDPEKGDNATGDIYWWDGKRIVDSAGRPADAEGRAYGTDPLEPNEAAVKAFGHVVADARLQSVASTRQTVGVGFPDWFLLRRGRRHTQFETGLWGGRNESEPMVVAAYGPRADGRAVVDTRGGGPFSAHTHGSPVAQFHQVLFGLELHQGLSHLGMHKECTSPGAPGVPTWYIEDCKIIRGQMNYLPIRSTVRRCISAFNWKAESHNQGYFTSGFDAAPTFEEVIFYKNGYKNDPRTNADPRRTIFDRNIYQGGGAQMGHTYRNIISAEGGSGGPQMRLGGLIENSLIIEGYWYSSTQSNSSTNTWLTAGKQEGRSALVRNNVQFIYRYPNPNDPDTPGRSRSAAQPAWGYALSSASFGALVEGNIISGAMLTDDLGIAEHARGYAFAMRPSPDRYQDGNVYTLQRCTVRNNIGYRVQQALTLNGDWTGARGHIVEGNVLVADSIAGRRRGNLQEADQLQLRGNRFYANAASLPDAPWVGEGNTLAPYGEAAEKENWPDPDRTLKRYVTEVLKLELLDWSDDPWLPAEEVAPRVAAGEVYDTMGLKTFMAVATNMRRGGKDAIPEAGKPSWTGDYPWDARFTGQAVVNWIRAGFGMEPVGE